MTRVSKLALALAAAAALLSIAACGGGDGGKSGSAATVASANSAAPAGSATVVPAATPSPTASPTAEMHTAAGVYRVVAVEIGDRGPAGCASPKVTPDRAGELIDCLPAPTAQAMLTVTLAPAGVATAERNAVFTLAKQVFAGLSGTATPVAEPAHILHSGERSTFVLMIDGNTGGIRSVYTQRSVALDRKTADATIKLVAPVPADAKNLQLVWPDNPPVDLTPLIKR